MTPPTWQALGQVVLVYLRLAVRQSRRRTHSWVAQPLLK